MRYTTSDRPVVEAAPAKQLESGLIDDGHLESWGETPGAVVHPDSREADVSRVIQVS